VKLDNSRDNFERSVVDVFHIQAFVGNIQRVRIGHDNSGLGPGWFLQDVAVKAPNQPDVHFDLPASGRWFDKREDDGQVATQLCSLTCA
jgi:hypothetical protein